MPKQRFAITRILQVTFADFQINMGQFGVVLGLFALFDRFSTQQQKDQISEYIFGFHDVSFSRFENDVIRMIFRPILNTNNQIVFWRAAVLSVFTTAIWAFIGYASEQPSINTAEIINNSWTNVAIGTAIIILFDYSSYSITKNTFLDDEIGSFFSNVLIDFFLKLIIIAVLLLTLVFIENAITGNASLRFQPIEAWEDGYEDYLLYQQSAARFVVIVALQSAFTLSAVQIFVLAFGSQLRFLILISRINSYIALNSNFLSYPFSFVGMFAGIAAAIVF